MTRTSRKQVLAWHQFFSQLALLCVILLLSAALISADTAVSVALSNSSESNSTINNTITVNLSLNNSDTVGSEPIPSLAVPQDQTNASQEEVQEEVIFETNETEQAAVLTEEGIESISAEPSSNETSENNEIVVSEDADQGNLSEIGTETILEEIVISEEESGGSTYSLEVLEGERNYLLTFNSEPESLLSENSLTAAITMQEVNVPIQVELQGLRSELSTVEATIHPQAGLLVAQTDLRLATDVLQLEDVDVDQAVIRLTKNRDTQIESILHCPSFRYQENDCLDPVTGESLWEEQSFDFVDFGNYVEFTVSHFSAYAAAEIVAVDAQHLDSSRIVVENIFEDIETIDEQWSNAIYNQEFVRVRYESDLQTGNVIDFIARSNGTIARVEVYVAGTDELVAESAVIDLAEHQYFAVSNLETPTDTFDFKVVAMEDDPGDLAICYNNCELECTEEGLDEEQTVESCSNDCLAWCPLSSAPSTAEVFVEFDFIHDGAITSTDADGLIVYGELDTNTPRFRTWNNSNDFEVEQSALNIGAHQTWIVLDANHQRDELLLATVDKSSDINVQVYSNGTGWHNQSQLTATTENSAYRSVDIAYEDVSGDALIVYEDSNSGGNNDLAYVIWNGSEYSAEQTLETDLANGEFRWVTLETRPGTDTIMLLAHNDLNDLYMVLWNGTDFDTSTEQTPSTGTSSSAEPHFDFAWEANTDEALLVYGEGNNFVYRQYDLVTGLDSENTIGLGHNLDNARLCSSLETNQIGAIWQDSGNDVWVRMWDGTGFLTGQPNQDFVTEPSSSNNMNIDCGWINSSTALFGYVDNNFEALSYFSWSEGNVWSVSSLADAPETSSYASNDIRGVRFTEHPTTEEIMITTLDTAEDVTVILYNGTEMVSIPTTNLESSTEVNNGAQEAAQFAWFTYDPNPEVTKEEPNGDSFLFGDTVALNISVTDNLAVSQVFANVTLPNGTLEQVELTDDPDNDTLYNISFSTTNLGGTYTVQFIANDTSRHHNYNDSQTVSFTVDDTIFPAVATDYSPLRNSVYNYSQVFEVAANVTDNAAVQEVTANVTFPNGTIEVLTLNFQSGSQYNASFTAPALLGDYFINFSANDSGGNFNETEFTNFSVVDLISPNVTTLLPALNSEYNVSNVFELAATVADDLAISQVFVNISYPNGTLETQELSFAESSTYNTSFTAPALIGTYNLTFVANDTSANLNESETSNFTIFDVSSPSASITTPLIGSSFASSASVLISATITDDIEISQVFANITAPNGTVEELELELNVGDSYNVSTSKTGSVGTYNIQLIVNDSSNNIDSSQSRNFVVQDSNTPLVSLSLPENGSYFNVSSVSFSCSATDNGALANISLFHNASGSFALNTTDLVSGLTNESNNSLSGFADGQYLWNCQARDSSDNAAFASENFSFFVDTTSPDVSSVGPSVDSEFAHSQTIEVNASITDQFTIDTVFANVTFPNSTVEVLTLSDLDADGVYNASFAVPILLGNYNISIIANDSAENVNDSQTSNFTVVDQSIPSLSSISCLPSLANLSDQVQCNSSASDELALSSVFANLTQPNGTIVVLSGDAASSNYHVNITANYTTLTGQYNVTWIASDSSSNTNTSTDSFVINDSISPTITAVAPTNDTNGSSSSVTFTILTTDNYDTSLSCEVYIDGSLVGTDSSVSNGSNTNFVISSISEGLHEWNASCSDAARNSNSTVVQQFRVDQGSPSFISLNTTPDSDLDLDPGVNVTVRANVTEDLTSIDTVILSYKLSNESNYTNLSMVNQVDGLFNATFNATVNGTYNLELWANDSLGNFNSSNQVNLSVQLDANWSVSPQSSFDPVSALSGENTTLGNLTVTNTGDVALNFTLDSDRSSTVYNQTENVSLGSGESFTLAVNVTAPTGGLQTTTLTLAAALNGSEDPSLAPSPELTEQTITGTVVVAPGQPVLVTSFTTPSAESITVSPGQENVAFVGKISNIGEGNASNVSASLEIPEDWTITFGSGTENYEEILSSEFEEFTAEITIPGSETPGSYVIYLNVTGVNETGGNLSDASLTFSDFVNISVQEDSILGSISSGSSTSGGSSSSSSGGGGSGGGGVGGGGGLARSGVKIQEEIVNVKQGRRVEVPISIANYVAGRVLHDLEITIDGFLSQYVAYSPQFIGTVAENSVEEITLTIDVPDYVPVGDYEFSVHVGGFETTSNGLVDVTLSYLEQYNFDVRVEALSEEELALGLGEVEALISELRSRGVEVNPLVTLLSLANSAIDAEDLTLASSYLDQIRSEYAIAIEALEQLEELSALLLRAQDKWLDVEQTQGAISLAQFSLREGDYTQALERANNAQLVYFLETKGKVNLTKFFIDNWWMLLSAMVATDVALYLLYKRLHLFVIGRKLQGLNQEDISIRKLMVEAQRSYAIHGTTSDTQYESSMKDYKKRLAEIKKQRSTLTKRKAATLRAVQKVKVLQAEKGELKKHIKEVQHKFFVSKELDKLSYKEEEAHFKERIAEIDHELSVLKEKNPSWIKRFFGRKSR